jgi:thiol-disulfide isomerase/thioredoxin
MSKNKKIAYACIFFILLVIGLKIYKKYNVAPDIKFKSLELTDLEDRKINWEQIPKPIFINYFGTWCIDCRKEMPELIALGKILAAEHVSIILISDESTATLQNYVSKNNIPFKVYHAVSSFKELGIVKFPTSYLLDKKGRIVYSATDVQPWTDHGIVEQLKQGIK